MKPARNSPDSMPDKLGAAIEKHAVRNSMKPLSFYKSKAFWKKISSEEWEDDSKKALDIFRKLF